MQRFVESDQASQEVILGIPIKALDVRHESFKDTNYSVNCESSIEGLPVFDTARPPASKVA